MKLRNSVKKQQFDMNYEELQSAFIPKLSIVKEDDLKRNISKTVESIVDKENLYISNREREDIILYISEEMVKYCERN